MRVAVTGARGLLGSHATARLHSYNCGATFKGDKAPFEIVQITRDCFLNVESLADKLASVDAILHFAGVNRGDPLEVEDANIAIAEKLVKGCKKAGVNPSIFYANSTHAINDTPYGRSKKRAGEILREYSKSYCDFVLPHIFGEGAKPYYNNVTATLIDQIYDDVTPEINPSGVVYLLHAGEAVQMFVDALLAGRTGTESPMGFKISVAPLYEKLKNFHQLYGQNIFPNLNDDLDLCLFNSYRSARFSQTNPILIDLHKDNRGVLFETAKGGGSTGQSFMSTTSPGITRGDHFHCNKVERFLVVRGEAIIRLRRVLTNELHEFKVSGSEPMAIDMPPLYTHSIENVGDGDLYTLFWAHEMFDPNRPDTYADPVLRPTQDV